MQPGVPQIHDFHAVNSCDLCQLFAILMLTFLHILKWDSGTKYNVSVQESDTEGS